MFNKIYIRPIKINLKPFSTLAQNVLLDKKNQIVSLVDNKLRYSMKFYTNFANSFQNRENKNNAVTVFCSPPPKPNYSFIVAFIFGLLAVFTRNKKIN